MSPKLRLGVIGAGSWAVASHLPNLAQRREDVQPVAICRKGPGLLEKVKRDFGFEVASEDYRDVIDASIDICVVSSPPGLHYEHTKAALEAGAHVLVEKPFTIEPAHAWELVETANRKGLHLVISFGWNYKPMIREAKRLMTDYGIGRIEHMTLSMASVTRELLTNTGSYPEADPVAVPEQATWTDPQLAGGGYAQAQLSHVLGLALWLTNLRGAEVFALMKSELDAPVELHDAIAVRFDGGAIGTISGGSSHLSSWDDHQVEMRAIGSDGQLHLDLERDREAARLFRSPEEDFQPPLERNAGLYDCIGPPNVLVDLALGREVVNCSPGELGARTVEILEAAYRSARSARLEAVSTMVAEEVTARS